MSDDVTTVLDATHDLAAALEMYAGAFGSEGTTIETVSIESSSGDSRGLVKVTLDNGDVFEVRVQTGILS